MEISTSTVLIVSDIHIREKNEEKVLRLLAALEKVNPSVTEALVFLGDIFDFCFGDSLYFQQKFQAIGTALTRLTRGGVRVVFLEGNHEFFLSSLGWEGVTWVSASEYILTTRAGTRIALTHGDLLLAPWHYRLYMGTVRSWLSRHIASWLPQAKFDRFCLDLAAHSRRQGMYKKVPHRRLLEKATQWIESTGCTVGVMGHYHVPYDYQHGSTRLFCLPAWDTPNFLGFDGTEWGRIFL